MATGLGRALYSLLGVGATCAALLVLGVTAARAELKFSTAFGSAGTGAGQFAGPQGIGVDQTTLGPTSGDVYVADTGNARVEQFGSAGGFIRMWGWGVADGASSFEVCTSACRAGVAGTGAGQFSSPTSVAVDSSSGLSQGDIYVGDSANKVVDKFSPSGSLLATITGPSLSTPFASVTGVAADGSGDLWVVDGSAGIVYAFGRNGAPLAQFADGYGYTQEIAADAAGNVYLIRASASGQTERWTPAARAAGGGEVEVDRNSATGLAVDLSTNNLYVDLGGSIDEFEAAGKSLGNFGSGSLSHGAQMAYDPGVTLPGAGGPGALYVADQSGNDVAVFVLPPPAAPTVLPNTESATNITSTAAALHATIDANGLDTKYFFEYGPTTAYGTKIPVPPGTDIGSNYAAASAAVELSGLTRSTTYHFRVVATNSLGTTEGQDTTFTTATPLAPAVESETTASITPTKVTLQATVNPEFADTHYIFEYGPTAAYGTKVPLPPGTDIGESSSGQSASVELSGLAASTTYHFRVVATNSVGTTDGADATVTTMPPALIESALATNVTATAADLRTKINPEGVETHYRFEYGTTLSYGSNAPVPDGAIGAVETPQGFTVHVENLEPGTKYYFRVVATNAFGTITGSAQTFTTYPPGGPSGLPDARAYELVSPLETNGGDVGGNDWAGSFASGLAKSSIGGSAVTYVGSTAFAGSQSAEISTQYVSSRGPSGWSTQAIMPLASTTSAHLKLSVYAAFTPELTAGVLEWLGLAQNVAPENTSFFHMYKHELGTTTYQLLGPVLSPGGGEYEVKFAGASPDLNHIVLDASGALTKGAPEAQSVYEWTGGSLRLVSVLPGPGNVAAASAEAGAGGQTFANDVSADGSRIFWTDNIGQLYVREDGARTVKLNASQRTPSLGDGSAKFRTATADGSKVFFTDETPLTGGPGDNGGLYEYDFNSAKLTDLSPDGSGSPGIMGVVGTSEDGLSVYFVASASLAGGATPGKDNLYLYQDGAITFIAVLNSEDILDWTQEFESRRARVTPDGGHLAFMSQEPLTGYNNIDANTGVADTEVFVYDASTGHLACASCNPSGERPIGSSSVTTPPSPTYIPRYISDDGQRVFFNSSDALVPAATNGQQNVYEYEHGVVYLISSGTSEDLSAFADASPDGNNLFFTTRARLVPEDKSNNAHLYDARVGGGFPAGALPPASCSGEGCRGPLSAPPTPVGVATESGNAAVEDPGVPVEEATTKPKTKPKRHTRKSGTGRSGRKSRAGKSGRKSKARRSHPKKAGKSGQRSGRRGGAAR